MGAKAHKQGRHYTRGSTQGFTLIELMIVIAIIAVLLSLALPAYQDYTIRSKVTEGVAVAASAKAAVSTACQVDPTLSPTNSSVGWTFTPSKYIQSIQISNSCSEPWIVIRTRNTGASPNVVMSLDGYFDAGEGRVLWHCHHVAGKNEHIPKACHGPHGLQNL